MKKKSFILALVCIMICCSYILVGCGKGENEVPEAPKVYELTTLSNNNEYGQVIGGGKYEYGKQVEIAAIANEGYVFVKWSDENSQSTRTVTVTSNLTYTAYFEKEVKEYRLDKVEFYPTFGTSSPFKRTSICYALIYDKPSNEINQLIASYNKDKMEISYENGTVIYDTTTNTKNPLIIDADLNKFKEGDEINLYVYAAVMCLVSEDAGSDENHGETFGKTYYNIKVSQGSKSYVYYKDVQHGYDINIKFSFSEL